MEAPNGFNSNPLGASKVPDIFYCRSIRAVRFSNDEIHRSTFSLFIDDFTAKTPWKITGTLLK